MDLFSLVAKLTLDAKEYEKALKSAEGKGKGAKLDAQGNITVTDNYSTALDQLKNSANGKLDITGEAKLDTDAYKREATVAAADAGRKLDAEGDASLNTGSYVSDAETAATDADGKLDAEGDASLSDEDYQQSATDAATAAEDSLDAQGEADLDDTEYQNDAETAAQNAGDSLDAQGDASLSDESYLTDAEAAAESAGDKLDAEGDASLNDSGYLSDADTASSDAGDKLDAEGDATLNDTTYLEDAQSMAGSADDELNAEGDATLNTTQYVQDAENAPGGIDIDAEGSASLATTDYENTASTASGNAASELDAEGDATLNTDGYGTNVEGLAESIGDSLDAEGEAGLDDSTYIDDAQNMATDAEDDLAAEGDASLDDSDYETDVSTAAGNAEGKLDIVGVASLDPTAYEADAENAGKAAGSTFADSLMGALKVAGLVAGVGTAANAFMDMVNNTTAFADEIDKGSQRLGISARAYQEWSYALSQSGASINSLNKGILIMKNARIGEMSEDVQEAFEALQIDPTAYSDTESLLNDTIMALAGIDSGSRETLLTKIFGKNGSELAAFFNTGEEGIKQLIKDAADLGLIMSDEDIAQNVALGDQMANIGAQVEALNNQVISALAPALITICEAVVHILSYLTREAGGLGRWINEYGVGRGFYYWMKMGDKDADFIKNYEADKATAQYMQTDEYKQAVAVEKAATTQSLLQQFAGYYGLSLTQSDPMKYMQEVSKLQMLLVQKLLDDAKREDSGVKLETKDEYGSEYGQGGKPATRVTIDGTTKMVVTAEMGTDYQFLEWLMRQYAEQFGLVIPQNGLGGEFTVAPGEHAKGLWEVPYDNYLADLHRDEMVLTASQAREYKDSGNDNGAIVEAIRGLRTDMTNLQIIVGEKTFGRTVVRYGGKRLGGYLGGAEDRTATGYGWG